MVHALYAKQKAQLPKVKVFLDFLTEIFTARTAKKKR